MPIPTSEFPQRLSRGNYAIAFVYMIASFIVVMMAIVFIGQAFGAKFDFKSGEQGPNIIAMITMEMFFLVYGIFFWLSVRRMHDTGRTGLLCIAPY
ncbi:DUF805 domain-containing protein [Candidatus Peregrinibacteria bacterium]|nr:DUF805 domain-containing protein [Candidatus Peregrinibacteria bacterium]